MRDRVQRWEWSLLRLVLVGLVASFAGGCATYADHTRGARSALDRGDLAGGVKEYNRVLKVKKPEDLPKDWKKDKPLALLERGTVLQGMGNYETSARDLSVADKQLEFLDIARDTAGNIGKYVYSDSATKFKTSPTEKLSLNAVNMINFLARGDLEGAKVEAKRFTVMRKYFREWDPEHEHGAFGSYLAGFVFERLGNAEEALRYYDESLQERDFASLRAPIGRLAQRTSWRGKRVADYVGTTPPDPAPADARPAEILVVAKVGRVPHKEAARIPIGAAVGMAGAFITGNPAVLAHSMFKVVVYPELVPAQNLFDEATLAVNGAAVSMDLATDLGAEIIAEYEEMKPKIIGAAISRMIVRAAASAGAYAAGSQAKNGGGAIGILAALAVEGTLTALDKPDTRSWTTLPGRVFVGRIEVPAGVHEVVVTVSGKGGRQEHRAKVKVPAGGFAVFDVTTLR